MSSQDEVHLIRAAASGDRVALTQLFLIHHDSLRFHVRQQVETAPIGTASADDILQQVFVRAAQAVGTFEIRGAGSFRGWLKTIATNLVKDARKRRLRERRASRPEQPLGDAESSVGQQVDRLAADNTPAIRRVQRRESARRLRSAVAQLPNEQRDIVERYYLTGESLDQIAESTGRTKGAVRGLCYRAREQLRVLMGRSSLYFSG
jgi:RNA polymerase sigma-70 factor (ECF subfamily)